MKISAEIQNHKTYQMEILRLKKAVIKLSTIEDEFKVN